MPKNNKETTTLLLLDGSTISISYPEDCDHFDEVYEEMIEAIEGGKFWNVGNWTFFTATYRGIPLQNINCRLVVGSV